MKLPDRITALTAKQWRNGITYAIGAGGLIFEIFSNGAEKPTLIVGLIGLIGLPKFFNKDEKDAAAAVPPIPPAPPPTDPPTLIPIPPLTSETPR